MTKSIDDKIINAVRAVQEAGGLKDYVLIRKSDLAKREKEAVKKFLLAQDNVDRDSMLAQLRSEDE